MARAHNVLIVDPEFSAGDKLAQVLHGHCEIVTAVSAAEARERLKNGCYAVVAGCETLPDEDGQQFLASLRPDHPDTTLILLGDGGADGCLLHCSVSRCAPLADLAKAVAQGVRRFAGVRHERKLLRQAVDGLSEIINALVGRYASHLYGRSARMVPLVEQLCAAMKLEAWTPVTAARLSIIGLALLPDEVLAKCAQGAQLTRNDLELYGQHALRSSSMIRSIPRLEDVAEILAAQEKHFDGGGFPINDACGEQIPLGARILKVVSDYDMLLLDRKSPAHAVSLLIRRPGWYDPAVMAAFRKVLGPEAQCLVREVYPLGLEPGMILDQDLMGTRDGRPTKLLAKGHVLTPSLIAYLTQHADKLLDVTAKITVREPLEYEAEGGATEDQGPAGPQRKGS